MRYLSYLGERRRPWTEHTCFPAKAIKLWREGGGYRARTPFLVFQVSDDRRTITPVPEEDWEGWL